MRFSPKVYCTVHGESYPPLGLYLIRTIRGYSSVGVSFVDSFISIVGYFATSFFVVAHVLLIAQLSGFGIHAAHSLPDIVIVFAGCVRVRACV